MDTVSRVLVITITVLALRGHAVADPAPSKIKMPQPRELSGQPRADNAAVPGSLAVRVTYNDLADPKPPVGVPVTLVGYAADDAVSVVTRSTDKQGRVTFDALDRTGAIAYYALALLPRNGSVDRLISSPIVFDNLMGDRLILSGDRRTSKTPPIDELAALEKHDVAVPAGAIRVVIDGVGEPDSKVTLVDATTKKGVASAAVVTKDGHGSVDLAFKARADQVLYADVTSRGETYRSLPFLAVPARGTAIRVFVYPRVLFSFQLAAEARDDQVLGLVARFTLSNNSWAPVAASAGGLAIPLPNGFKKAEVRELDRDGVTVTPTGLSVVRPIPPGGRTISAVFELAAAKGQVRLAVDLPLGSFQSAMEIAKDPGMTVEPPAGVTSQVSADGSAFVLPDITITPNQPMVMTIGMPRWSKAVAATVRACRPLAPERRTPLRGKPMPDFTAEQLDGTKLKLSSLRGKVILVNFMSSWDALSTKERPGFGKLVGAVGDVAVVLVSSDRDKSAVAKLVGAKPPYRVVLDPPAGETPLGPITGAWGVRAVPETFVIDRSGTLRLYFPNMRDWSSAEAIACIKAIKAQ
jgi:peroxiredoxin